MSFVKYLCKHYAWSRGGILSSGCKPFGLYHIFTPPQVLHVNVTQSISGPKFLRLCARLPLHATSPKLFSTSQTRHLNPVVWAILRPLVKLTAAVFGRGIRKWWRDLPKDKKGIFLDALKRNKYKIVAVVGFGGGLVFVYYVTHLQEAPLTYRRRLIAFNDQQIQKLADFQFDMLVEDLDNLVLPQSDPLHKRVQSIADRLVKGNLDVPSIQAKTWSVTVIDDLTENAFVLPNGKIFVYKGMTNLCRNDDQLGIILGHEMAHAILDHGAEKMSYMHVIDLIAVVIVGTIWAILPTDLISLLAHWLMNKVIQLTVELPYERQLETEADQIGLTLSAKACFDVRESSAFWKRMDIKAQQDGDENVEWLSTHPGHDSRHRLLELEVPEAILLRQMCKCPPLPAKDPRNEITIVDTKNPEFIGLVKMIKTVDANAKLTK